mmetsp:Transcript_29666/g.46492  ORF Transcript_29666/g.46492 Transcript_29666/m.46492 type:complete len:112 (-) Transcript_29666:2067-2402(-)
MHRAEGQSPSPTQRRGMGHEGYPILTSSGRVRSQDKSTKEIIKGPVDQLIVHEPKQMSIQLLQNTDINPSDSDDGSSFSKTSSLDPSISDDSLCQTLSPSSLRRQTDQALL